MFYVEEVTEHDLPEFLLERLRENPALLEKVCKETGWDKPWILGIEVTTPTPSPTPVEVSDEGSGDDSEDEVTPTQTPTPTKTPVPERTEAEPEQDDLEKLLEELLAMITPTASPTPVWVAETAAEPEQSDDDDDSSSSSTPTPTATPAPTATATPTPSPSPSPSPAPTPVAVSGKYSYDSSQNPYYELYLQDNSGNDIAILGFQSAQLTVRSITANNTPVGVDLTNPIEIKDNASPPAINPNPKSFISLSDIDYNDCSMPVTATKTVNGVTYKIVREEDPNSTGNFRETIYQDNVIMPTPAGGFNGFSNPYIDSITTAYSGLNSMISYLKSNGHPNM